MHRNESYVGVNALFHLPVDKSKADPQAAATYLKDFEESMNEPDEPIAHTDLDSQVEKFMEMLTPENLDEYAEPIEETRQVCTIDENGKPHYSYKLENSAGDGVILTDLSGIQPGSKVIDGWNYSDDGLEGLEINVLIVNEDGTITFVLYQPRKDQLVPLTN